MRRLLLATVRRVAIAAAIVFGVLNATWLMTSLLPGDPAQVMLGPNASPKDVAKAREILELDGPRRTRYARFVVRMVHPADGEVFGRDLGMSDHKSCWEPVAGVHVDLGTSHIYRKPVIEVLKQKLPYSLKLAVAALGVQLLLGLALGVAAAVRRGTRVDEVVVSASTTLAAAPTFIVGLLLQFFLAHRLGWLPLDARGVSPTMPSAEEARAMILPALTLGIYGTAILARFVRSELADTLDEPFVRTARAKGASALRATFVHAFRAAAGPIAQLVVLDLGALIGGAIVTERIFRWPGLGDMSVAAIENRDAAALVGVTLVAAVAMVVATTVADIVGMVLDPRRR